MSTPSPVAATPPSSRKDAGRADSRPDSRLESRFEGAPAVSRREAMARQQKVLAALSAVMPAHALLWRDEDRVPYECDGLTAYRKRPPLVALPETNEQVSAV